MRVGVGVGWFNGHYVKVNIGCAFRGLIFNHYRVTGCWLMDMDSTGVEGWSSLLDSDL